WNHFQIQNIGPLRWPPFRRFLPLYDMQLLAPYWALFTNGTVSMLGAVGPLFEALCIFLVRWLILFWMYRRRIFIKA
ncbi:MAG: hypothetical protein ACYS30_20125, partial [Planctomycetota bacterium]